MAKNKAVLRPCGISRQLQHIGVREANTPDWCAKKQMHTFNRIITLVFGRPPHAGRRPQPRAATAAAAGSEGTLSTYLFRAITNDSLTTAPNDPRNTRESVSGRTCIALIGHLKPRNVAIATMDNAATAVDSWKVKKFFML